MEGTTASPSRFQHLREHSIGLPQVLFQSITHMAPAAAVAYSIYISVPDARQALPLSIALALIACICAATAIGQLAKLFPSAGGMYTYAANGLAPRPLGRTHPDYKTPHVAIIWMSLFALGLALLIGAIWDPLTGFAMIATAAVPVVIVVYMLVSVACITHYAIRRRGPFNPLLHLILPVAGMVLFFFPLYYQFYKAPPDYPIKGANWVALAWAVIGVALSVWLARWRPERLRDMERVYMEDIE